MSSIVSDTPPEVNPAVNPTGNPAEYLCIGTPPAGYAGFQLESGIFLARRVDLPENKYIKLTIAVCGSVDAGKTTTQAVLTQGYTFGRGVLDDGCGLVRKNIFNHPHERESGRTSSISRMIISYNEENVPGNQSIRANQGKGLCDWGSIITKSTKKLVTMIDLCGHDKYRKTTISGSMSEVIDYVMITISGSDNGLKKITCEHILLAMSLRVPFFIVMTKVDSTTPDNVVEYTLRSLRKWLSLKHIQKTTLLIKDTSDITEYLRNPETFNEIVPVIQISNVTGMNVLLLSAFIGCLPVSSLKIYHDTADDTYARVTEVYTVRGIGTVILCCVMSGVVKKGGVMYLGPFHTKPHFRETRVKSIQKNRVPVIEGVLTDIITVAVSVFNKRDVRRGMILVSDPGRRKCALSFSANITVLRHQTTISTGYKPVVFIANVRASAKVTEIIKTGPGIPTEPSDLESRIYLRTRDTAIVTFTFENGCEYIRIGDTVVVNDGNMKATGTISSISV